MNCPICDGSTSVINSRTPTNDIVKRRRKCMVCGYRFNTVETVEVPEAKKTYPTVNIRTRDRDIDKCLNCTLPECTNCLKRSKA